MKKKRGNQNPPAEFSIRALKEAARDSWKIRWRKLTNGTDEVRAYASIVPNVGYSGFTKELLKEAPCTHCGEPGKGSLPHLCSGVYSPDSLGISRVCAYDGQRLKDGRHVCEGRPSQSWHGTLSWKLADGWKEI